MELQIPTTPNSVRMTVSAEKIGEALFPKGLRAYVTFRLVTGFVAVLTVWNIVFGLLVKGQLSQFHPQARGVQLLHSPYLLILYNIGIAIGFWAIYATRERTQYYRLRVICYGMLLAGVVGEVLHFLSD